MEKFRALIFAGTSVAAAALCLTATTSQAATIVANFAGLNNNQTAAVGSGIFAPPDTDGAIGINHFVEFINGGYQVYNRAGGAVGATITDSQFWLNAGISSTLVNQGLSDTRIKFDANSGRWFAAEISIDGNNAPGCCSNNSVLIGVSKTSDPTAGWAATSFNVSGLSRFNDYPTLGVDANGVYIGTNDFNAAGTAFVGVTVTSIPKASLLTLVPTVTGLSTFVQNTASPTLGTTPQVVTNDGTGYTGAKIIANNANNFNEIQLTNINNTAGPGATLGASVTVTTAFDGATTNVRQPDGSRVIDGLDNRFSGTVYQVGNLIYAANAINNGNTGNVNGPGSNSIHWLVLDATTNAVLQEGLITDGTRDLWQPSIAANAFGDVVIGYNKAGTDLNISSFAAVGHTSGGLLTFEAPLLLKTGTVNNYRNFTAGSTTQQRWGDYSATMVDPTDPFTFWTIQELPFATTTWGTWISAINVRVAAPAVPEPSSWALMIAGFGITGMSLRRRTKVVALA